MEKVEKKILLYVAKDGREFFDEDKCKEWEDVVDNIRYFVVSHSPDLTETGCMCRDIVVAVYSAHGYHKDIVENWCIREKSLPILQPSVQGYRYQRGFDIYESQEICKKVWQEYKKGARVNPELSLRSPYYDEKVFLSPMAVEGFPEPFNYLEAWDLKLS